MTLKCTEQTTLTEAVCLNVDYLPPQPLYAGTSEDAVTDADRASPATGWELSPVPYALTEEEAATLQRLGGLLWRFEWACEHLYRASLKGKAPTWIAELMHRGKPEDLLKFAQMKRLRGQMPLVLRPDLLVTDEGFRLTEIDAVPGGIGFTAAMNEAYRRSGFSVVESESGIPEAFVQMLRACAPTIEEPVIAVVISDEAADYEPEMRWLVDAITPFYPYIHLVHPKQLELVRDALVFQSESGEEHRVDVIYRFFELFDRLNIPKMELIQYAVKKGWVACSPPFKPHLEEKSWLALVHHPALTSHWTDYLDDGDLCELRQLVPAGWVVDPSPLQPAAVIPNLRLRGDSVQSFHTLKGLTQKERQLVLKPSGFSELAWGSRGVTIGHDVSGEVWDAKLDEALASYEHSPYLLQEFHKPAAATLEKLDVGTGKAYPFSGRTRLCPYYFVTPDKASPEEATVTLAGVLATSCPADKKIIHGMKDAVMAPCQIVPEYRVC